MSVVKTYFKPGPEALAAIAQYEAAHEAYAAGWERFITAHVPSGQYMIVGGTPTAFVVGTAPPTVLYAPYKVEFPEGWKAAPKSWKGTARCGVPDKKTEQGKALLAEIAAIPKRPDWGTFQGPLGLRHERHGPLIGDGRWYEPAIFEKIGEEYVIEVRHFADKPAPVPTGCTHLLTSEVWALREAAGQKEAA